MTVKKASRNGTPTNNHRAPQSIYGWIDPIANNKLAELANNFMSFRTELARQLMDPRRDVEEECGHPPIDSDVNIEIYKQLYEREGIATRVVEVFPKEAWQITPSIYEEEDPNKETQFEKDWDSLGSQLRGKKSWYKDEEGSPIWEALKRAHIHSRIGRFGILLIGINDGKKLEEPVEGVEDPDEVSDTSRDTSDQYGNLQLGPQPSTKDKSSGKSPNGKLRKLLYLRSVAEPLAQVTEWEKDVYNRRFGLPKFYNITVNDPKEFSGIGPPMSTMKVHWTRVIHIPGELGYPAMRPVLNYLLNLHKLYGGSAEMYWKGAFPGYSLETHPQLGGEVDINQDVIKDQMELYMNKLQRYLVLMGMSMKSQAPQVVDPSPQINMQIEAICMTLGIPKRKFMGSERGELSSTEDEGDWNGKLTAYNTNFTTPTIIIPFVDRLIAMRVLTEPEQWSCEWPDLNALSDLEKADLLTRRTNAYAQYISSGMESVVPPLDYMTRFDSMDEEEAEAILENAMEAEEEKMAEAQLQAEEMQADPNAPIVTKGAPGQLPAPQVNPLAKQQMEKQQLEQLKKSKEH